MYIDYKMLNLTNSIVKKILLISALCLCSTFAWAADQGKVTSIRVSSNPEFTRIVLDLDKPVHHSLFTLSGPERVVLDVKSAKLLKLPSKEELKRSKSLLSLRSATRNKSDLRMVLDMNHRVRPKSFMLKPKGKQGHRLVIDLYDARMSKSKSIVKTIPKPKKLRDVVVAIDAGHGGKDPGALGHKGLREKDVTLSIAKKLAAHVNDQKGMRAVLIRESDYFIPLRKRMVKARNHKADMFISIHADAFSNKKASGSSVYALSLNGATSEAAAWLADRENSADLIGGVTLDDKDDLLASVLLDLSQTATIQSSLEIGDAILGQLGRIKKLHKAKVQQAGFLVLKSPDIPSVLVETAFITNPKEAKNLNSKQQQDKMARAIVRGVRRYFSKKAPPDTWLADAAKKQSKGQSLALR